MRTRSLLGRAALSAVMAISLPVGGGSMAQSAAGNRAPRPGTLETYLGDLQLALRLGSDATGLRFRDVGDAVAALTYARRGLSLDGTFEPSSEFKRNRSTGIGNWEVDVEVELSAEYSHDRERILRAEIALERAKARLRAQRRSDTERALLAMSAARLSSSAVAEAHAEVAEAEAELRSAVAAGAPELELELLAVEAELAAVALEQELLESRDAATALAELGASEEAAPSAATSTTITSVTMLPDARIALMSAPPAPGLGFTDGAAPLTATQLTLLSLRLLLAEQTVALAPFETIRELEVYGGYEVGGVEAGARLALEVGVPTATTRLGWQSDVDDHAFSVGFGATMVLSDRSSAQRRVIQREVADARAALAAHVSSWPDAELQARRSAELAYREFELELRALELSRDALEQVEAIGDERAVSSARNAVHRAGETGERAWQRYVRALFDYLDVIDVVLRFD